jgi:ABC-type cobalamin/Fe3+-siderophores transport system ATPase subunit
MLERPKTMSRLRAQGVTLTYGDEPVVDNLDVSVPDGKITVIVGPNACGKSTLLRALARVLRPKSGSVILDGEEILKLPTREVARRLGLLPQAPISPQGIFVSDLVARGRTPHQSALQQWSDADEVAVLDALEATETLELADRRVDELSGGQRQRVWIAVALAQQTELLLLDEPTTFLDLPHQIDVLNLLRRLNRKDGRTIVVVLHDLNLACRYADHIIAMRSGRIVAEGVPAEVVTPETIRAVFDLDCQVIEDPLSKTPLVVPALEAHR